MADSPVIPVIPLAVVPDDQPRTAVSVTGGLPLPTLRKPRELTVVYGLRPIDTHGRVTETTLLAAVGWTLGEWLCWKVRGELIVITRSEHGAVGITKVGLLRILAQIRQRVGLRAGDRVLLSADPTTGVVVVYPPEVLDEMAGRRLAQDLDGTQS